MGTLERTFANATSKLFSVLPPQNQTTCWTTLIVIVAVANPARIAAVPAVHVLAAKNRSAFPNQPNEFILIRIVIVAAVAQIVHVQIVDAMAAKNNSLSNQLKRVYFFEYEKDFNQA